MPRPVGEQVVVVTGASSGIGRETAIQFGERGASAVLAARNEEALETAAREVERAGGTALVAPADVSRWEDMEALAARAIERFGRIDTWVNNAGISVYGTVEQVDPEELRRVIEVNLLGEMYGMRAALPHFRRQGGGAIINVASALADRAVPLQAAYCASKFGVRGFSEALRMEFESEGPPVSVTVIEPSSMNTPLFEHARSKIPHMPMPIPPVYEPRVVAEAIVYAAEHPQRRIVVGGAGKLLTVAQRINRRMVDWYMVRKGKAIRDQISQQPNVPEDNLFAPVPGPGRVTGDFGDGSKSVSLYTRWFEQHPRRKTALGLAGAAALVGLVRRVGR